MGPRPPPSSHVQRLAAELLALPPNELKQFRLMCRDRMIPKPAGRQGPVGKDYKPELPRRRIDQPLPVRRHLGVLGRRLFALHPAWVFAGHGPGILPLPMPQLGASVIAGVAMRDASQRSSE
mmetsp:Transcript_8323/g.18178  ORF Transcript_8323/g.18178 Transcript_8323/m.18178 type:complete len:122 (+) Transcript_8323:39-404(+)